MQQVLFGKSVQLSEFAICYQGLHLRDNLDILCQCSQSSAQALATLLILFKQITHSSIRLQMSKYSSSQFQRCCLACNGLCAEVSYPLIYCWVEDFKGKINWHFVVNHFVVLFDLRTRLINMQCLKTHSVAT